MEYDEIICEYDVAPLNGHEIKFTDWNFFEFINSHPLYKNEHLSVDYIDSELLKLVYKDVLSLLELDGIKYQTYQVNNLGEY